MVMLSVIQKNNNPHAILRSDNEGPGGGYHDYTVMDVDRKSVIAQIRFQKGARNDPNARDGVLDADLLEIVRDRLWPSIRANSPRGRTLVRSRI